MSKLTPAEIRENEHALAPLTQDQVWKMYEIERKAIARFSGQLDELEAAIGMMHIGYLQAISPVSGARLGFQLWRKCTLARCSSDNAGGHGTGNRAIPPRSLPSPKWQNETAAARVHI